MIQDLLVYVLEYNIQVMKHKIQIQLILIITIIFGLSHAQDITPLLRTSGSNAELIGYYTSSGFIGLTAFNELPLNIEGYSVYGTGDISNSNNYLGEGKAESELKGEFLVIGIVIAVGKGQVVLQFLQVPPKIIKWSFSTQTLKFTIH